MYIKSEKKFTLESDEGIEFLIKTEKDKYIIDFEYEEEDNSLKVNAEINNKVSKNSQDTSATIEFEYKSGSDKIKATITNDLTIEKNKKIDKLDTKKAVDVEDLSDEDMYEIYGNFMEIINDILEDIAPELVNSLSGYEY